MWHKHAIKWKVEKRKEASKQVAFNATNGDCHKGDWGS